MGARLEPALTGRSKAFQAAHSVRSPALVVALVCALFLSQPFLGAYYQSLLIQAFLFAILATTVNLLWGYTGILSFGQSAFFGIGGYAVGITWVQLTADWWAWPFSVFVGLAIAATVAAALGWFAFYTRTNVTVFYVAVITLAAAVIFEQLMLSGGSFTGSSSGLTGFRTTDLTGQQWYWVTGLLLLVITLLTWVFVRSDGGRVLVAIRDNEDRCRYLGINVPLIKTTLFTVAGVIAAASGLVYVAYTLNVAPSLVGFLLATNAIIWTALGGRGTLLGPIVGAILVNVFGASLNVRYPFHWQLFLGGLFVIVVMFLPQGILPAVWSAVVGGLRILGSFFRRPRYAALWKRRPGPERKIRRARTAVSPATQYLLEEATSPPPRLGEESIVLELDGVRKFFGSFEAVGGVSFVARMGELVSVVGPNGAGKTTMVRCIADGRERSAGTVRICGQSVDHHPPHHLVALGVGRKFQAANIFESLTVAESLQLASWKGRFPSVWRKSRTVALPAAALRVVRTTGLDSLLDERVRSLSHGQKQALEVAMVLALEPTVLLLDEPTAGLTHDERFEIARILTQLVEAESLCIVVIEHDFEFVKEISSRMIVLHEGKVLLDGTVSDVANSDVVRAVYLGQSAH